MDSVLPVINRGVISYWLENKPSELAMLVVGSDGNVRHQAIPVTEWGSISGSLEDQSDLTLVLGALDSAKVNKAGDTMTGNLTINNSSSVVRLNNSGQDWQLRAQYGDLNIEPVGTANSVFVRAGSGQQVTLTVAGINRISATANGASVTGDIRSDRAGSLSHVSPQNNIVLYGGFSGYGIGFDNNGELGAVVNSTLRSKLGQHLGLGSAGQVRFNSAADTSGLWDTLIVRNATGPAIETRSAGGLNVRNEAGSSFADVRTNRIYNPDGQLTLRADAGGILASFMYGASTEPLRVNYNSVQIPRNIPINFIDIDNSAAGSPRATILPGTGTTTTLDLRAATGVRVRTLDGSAAAGLDCGSISTSAGVIIGGQLQVVGDIAYGSGSQITWATRGILRVPATNIFRFSNVAVNAGFSFDVTTNGTATLRNLDNSAAGALVCGTLTSVTNPAQPNASVRLESNPVDYSTTVQSGIGFYSNISGMRRAGISLDNSEVFQIQATQGSGVGTLLRMSISQSRAVFRRADDSAAAAIDCGAITASGTGIVASFGSDPAVVQVGSRGDSAPSVNAFLGGYSVAAGNVSTVYFGQNLHYDGTNWVHPYIVGPSSVFYQQNGAFYWNTHSGNASTGIGTERMSLSNSGILTIGNQCRLRSDAGFASLSPTANRNFLLASGGVQLWNEGSFRSFLDWSTLGTVRFTDGSTGRVGIDAGQIISRQSSYPNASVRLEDTPTTANQSAQSGIGFYHYSDGLRKAGIALDNASILNIQATNGIGAGTTILVSPSTPGVSIWNRDVLTYAPLQCGRITSQYGATTNDIVAISNVGTVSGQTNAEGTKWQLVAASGADSLRLASTSFVGFNSTGNLNTGSIDASIRRNASGPTLDTWSAGGLRVRSADGSADAPIDASSLTFGSGCRLQGDAGFASLSPTANRNFLLASGGVQLWNEGSFRSFLDWSTLGTVRFTDGSTGRVGIDVGAITVNGNVNLRNNDTLRWDSGNATILFDGTGLQLNRSATQYVMYGNQHHLTGNFVKIGGSTNPAPDYRLQVHGDIAVRDSGNIQLFNAFTSTTNFESLRQQWTSNEARIGTAVGSAGGTQRNIAIGSWNAAGTWTQAISIRPSDPSYPVKFHGTTGIWIGDSTTIENARLWTSANAFELVNAGTLLGTGSIKLTDWNANTALAQLSIHHTKNLSFAIDTDNDDATSAFYFLGGTHASGNPTTNGLMKIEKGGNVGIGTMAPSAKLHVAGTVTANGALTVNNAAGIYETGSGRTVALTSNFSASTPGIGTTTTHDFCIYTDGANERLRISSTGLITAASRINITAADALRLNSASSVTGGLIAAGTTGFLPIQFGGNAYNSNGLLVVGDGSYLGIRNTGGLYWVTSTNPLSNVAQTAVISPSAGLVEINNGTAGQLRDLSCRAITLSGTITGSTKLLFSGTTGTDYGIINATSTRLVFGRNSTSDSIITVGLNPTSGQAGITLRRGEGIDWSGSTSSSEGGGLTAGIRSPAAGVIELTGRDVSFERLLLGGITNLFPAWKRSGTVVQARLADDSGFASVQGKLTTETNYTAGATTPTGYIVLYDAAGTAYKVPAEAL